MNDLKDIPLYLWVVLIVLLLAQGCWIFWDASKRGENKWLWGLFRLLNIPSNLIVYLIVTRVVSKVYLYAMFAEKRSERTIVIAPIVVKCKIEKISPIGYVLFLLSKLLVCNL